MHAGGTHQTQYICVVEINMTLKFLKFKTNIRTTYIYEMIKRTARNEEVKHYTDAYVFVRIIMILIVEMQIYSILTTMNE